MTKISTHVTTLLMCTNGHEQGLGSVTAKVMPSEERVKAQIDAFQRHVHSIEKNINDLKKRKRTNNFF